MYLSGRSDFTEAIPIIGVLRLLRLRIHAPLLVQIRKSQRCNGMPDTINHNVAQRA